jgi:hypothetical protein
LKELKQAKKVHALENTLMVGRFSENQSENPLPHMVGSRGFGHRTSGDITRFSPALLSFLIRI